MIVVKPGCSYKKTGEEAISICPGRGILLLRSPASKDGQVFLISAY
jgi:hypothetical protein